MPKGFYKRITRGGNYKDLTGEIYGLLSVIKDIGRDAKSKSVLWLCLCKCGKERIVKSNNLSSGNTKSCGHTRVEKNTGQVRPSVMGEKNWRWIEDRTKVIVDKDNERGSPLHKQWSRNVKLRDNWSCRIADINCDGKIIAHHILPWKNYQELRYEVNNGITLCHFHHPRKRNDEMILSQFFQELVGVKEQ